MVQRQSQDFNLNDPQGQGVAVPTQGAQQNVVDKYRTVRPTEGVASQVLQSLYGAAAKLGEAAWQASTAEAYVKGAAQAGVVRAEEELNNDSLTRDWEVAGYRDTTGKLLQAKQESGFLAKLPELRTKAMDEPGGLNDFLSEQRGEYEGTYNGMSRAAREGSVAKRITYEQQAIAQYTKERKAYIYDVRSTTLRGVFNPAIGKLESALKTGDAALITAARENVATIFAADVWADEAVSTADKRSLTAELLDRLFVTDDTGTYNMLDQAGLLGKLSAEDQTKYAEKYRESLGRNNARRFAEYHDELAKLKANMADPNSVDFPSIDTFKQVVDYGVYQGALKDQQALELRTSYYTALGKRNDQHGLATAYSTGNQDYIFGRGKAVQDAMGAWETAQYAAGKSTHEIAMAHVDIGKTRGWPEAYQRAGKLVAPVFSALLTTKEPPVGMVQTAKDFFVALDKSDLSGKTVDFAQVLAGIPEDMRGDVLSLRTRILQGNESAETAILAVADQKARDIQLTPSMRAGVAAAQGKTSAKILGDMQRGGYFNSLVKNLRSFVGMDASMRAARPAVGFFEGTEAADRYVANVQAAVEQHLSRAIQQNPRLNAEGLQAVAEAGIATSLLDAPHGPVMLPVGVDMHTYLNLPKVANKDNVASVLGKQTAATVEGARPVVSFEDSQVVVREYKDGAQVAQRMYPVSVVGDGVRELFKADAKRVDYISGDGMYHTDVATRSRVRFNGRNTAAVDDSLMFQFRQNLVKNEGVKAEAYADFGGKGRITVGVGITRTNDYFPKDLVKQVKDKIPEEVINSTFRDASNAAAKQGLQIIREKKLPNDKWFLVTSELAYQSGLGNLQNLDSYNELWKAGRAGDTAAAIAAFRSTPAWYNSKSLRRQHYEKLITQATRG